MKKQLIIIGLVALLVCVGLSGCSSNSNNTSQEDTNNIPPINPIDIEKNKFVGTWTRTSYDFGSQGIDLTVTFFSDGTMSASNWIDFNYGQNWQLKDGMLTINIAGSVIQTWNYVFSNNNNLLTLTSVDRTKSIVYTKQ